MPKIIALSALALLLPLGAVAQSAQTGDEQKFESRRLRDDMRQREQARERRKEQRFQDEQEAKKEERLHRQRMEATREGNRHQRDMKRTEEAREARERAKAAAVAQTEAEAEAELESALDSSDSEAQSAEAEALQEIEEIIEEVTEEAGAEDSLLLFALNGEPSRRQSYEWAQELPETGTFLFQWTYTYDGENYTASTELDIGFIPEGAKVYLPLAQHITDSERDTIRNYRTESGVIQIYGSSLVYAAFLNHTGLNFRFNPRASRAAGYSRFRDIRITRVEHEQETGE